MLDFIKINFLIKSYFRLNPFRENIFIFYYINYKSYKHGQMGKN